MLDTHISRLFFAGDRVYKVKKPVDLAFVDQRTLSRRRYFCEAEIRLNERLAPGVYLGVVDIVRRADGSLEIDGEGEPIECAVLMRRLPTERMLDRLLKSGQVDNALVNALVERLAAFHEGASTDAEVQVHGQPETIERNAFENTDALGPFCGSDPNVHVVSSPVLGWLIHWTERTLEELRSVFEWRIAEGRIRDGHGDLHAGNVCCLESGIVAYDCVEFDPRFRCSDIASDIAFLAMDLDRRGFRALAGYFVKRYADRSGDPTLHMVLRFYKLYRALFRAKVEALRSRQLDGEAAATVRRRAANYVHLGATYTLPRPLVLMSGLPGAGKSHVARAIVQPYEAALLRSDAVRKRLYDVALRDRVPDSRVDTVYSGAATDRTYAELLSEARRWLEGGRPVVIDAMFPDENRRIPFRTLAAELGAPLVIVHVTCPDDVVRDRLAARVHDRSEVSDADLEIHLMAAAVYTAPEGPEVVPHDGSGPADVAVAGVLDAVVNQVESRG